MENVKLYHLKYNQLHVLIACYCVFAGAARIYAVLQNLPTFFCLLMTLSNIGIP